MHVQEKLFKLTIRWIKMQIQSSQFILKWFKRILINKDDTEEVFCPKVSYNGFYNEALTVLKRNPLCKHCHVFVQNVNSVY